MAVEGMRLKNESAYATEQLQLVSYFNQMRLDSHINYRSHGRGVRRYLTHSVKEVLNSAPFSLIIQQSEDYPVTINRQVVGGPS